MTNKKTLCIIPLFNIVQLGYWDDLVLSISKTLEALNDIDFLLINNQSQDNTVEFAFDFSKKHTSVLFVDNKINNGSAGAFSQGIRYAKNRNYNYAYLIDQDTIFDSLSVLNLEKASDVLKNEYTILCSAVYSSDNKSKYLPNFRVKFDGFLCRFFPVKTDLINCEKIDAGGNTGLYINLHAIGDLNMDESFFYHMEDYDFCLKARHIKPIYLVPDSKIYHPDKYQSVSFIKQLLDDFFVVTLVKKDADISCKSKNTIVVYERNKKGKYLYFKKITTCLIALLFPKYSFFKTKEAVYGKTDKK